MLTLVENYYRKYIPKVIISTLPENEKKLNRWCLSPINFKIVVCVDHIYFIAFAIKDFTDKYSSISYLDLLRTILYDKRNEFKFSIVNFATKFNQHGHMEYISLDWSDIAEFVVLIGIDICY